MASPAVLPEGHHLLTSSASWWLRPSVRLALALGTLSVLEQAGGQRGQSQKQLTAARLGANALSWGQ